MEVRDGSRIGAATRHGREVGITAWATGRLEHKATDQRG